MEEILAMLSEQAADHLRQVLRPKSFSRNDRIFLQGDSPEAIYFIASGRVKISRLTPDGNEIILCVRCPNDIFCPVPLLDQGDQLGTAIALTDGKLFWIEREIFSNLCTRFPELLSLVQSDCLSEVRRLLGRMESYAYRSIRERLALALLEAMERNRSQGISVDFVHLTQADLAGIVGASRESISRTLSQFEDQGILKTCRGRIQVYEPDKLALIANSV